MKFNKCNQLSVFDQRQTTTIAILSSSTAPFPSESIHSLQDLGLAILHVSFQQRFSSSSLFYVCFVSSEFSRIVSPGITTMIVVLFVAKYLEAKCRSKFFAVATARSPQKIAHFSHIFSTRTHTHKMKRK